MGRWTAILAAVVVAAAATPAAAATGAELASLTARADRLEGAIRTAATAAERKRLTDELELVRHQIGPVDVRGRRVHPQAMWHAEAIERLAAEEKRLTRPMRTPGTGVAAHGRCQVRRMGRACLTHGWRLPAGALKYQVNVFGQYLAVNLPLLDGRFDRLLAHLSKEGRLPESSPQRAAMKEHLDKARAGVEAMGRAASVLDAPDVSVEPGAAAKSLGEFLEGLRAVVEAVEDLDRGADGGEVDASDEAASPAEPAGRPPPMTDEETATLAAVRKRAEALDGEDWAEVRRFLERYASAVENGFQVASARPKAREFLDQIDRAARLAADLSESKVAYPAYLEEKRQDLTQALQLMEGPLERANGYARLARLEGTDELRRRIEAGGLEPEGGQGVLYARLVTWDEMRQSVDPAVLSQAQVLLRACDRVAEVCSRLPDWPPEPMTGRLADLYDRKAADFRKSASEAGMHFPADRTKGIPAMAAAQREADDLALLVRADRVIQAVRRYLPARAQAMYARLLPPAQGLVLGRDDAARQKLTSLVRPFEGLEAFPLPDARHARSAQRLVGRSYTKARSVFSRDVALGIDAATKGDPAPLSRALYARWLFELLLHRSIALTDGLEEAGVANLPRLPMPPTVWEPFVEKLDQDLRSRFARYAGFGAQTHTWMKAPEVWDIVYQPVLAAQRLAVDGRTEGESDAAFLLRNLDRTTVADPSWTQWYSWAGAYHAVEAATTMNAGQGAAADWHRSMIHLYGRTYQWVKLERAEAVVHP